MTPRYFLATDMKFHKIVAKHYNSILVALPNIKSKKDIATLQRWAADGKQIIIDSGVFELCSNHARVNNIPFNKALGLPPTQVDGFAKLLDHYERVAGVLTGTVFAIAELDIGGKIHKRATRDYLESKGIAPTPVFHPMLDGWKYLDELAQKYKIILVGNVVDAPLVMRLSIMKRLMRWRQQHQSVWIHLLGVTPSTVTLSMPFDSYDSSTWLGSVRWANMKATALWNSVGGFDRGMIYDRQDTVTKDFLGNVSYTKAVTVAVIDESCQSRSAEHFFKQIEQIMT